MAFSSSADTLSAADNDGVQNVFLRDLRMGTTTLVGRANGPAGAIADMGAYDSAISADGRFVVFSSGASNLSAEDDDSVEDIFLRDIQMATTTLVSRANGPEGAGADGDSGRSNVSADGRFVVFEAQAGNLSPDDNDASRNVFRRDVRGGPPQCTDVAETVVRDVGTAVGLICTDDDGDAMTFSIASTATLGALGAIDQTAGSVIYTPNIPLPPIPPEGVPMLMYVNDACDGAVAGGSGAPALIFTRLP